MMKFISRFFDTRAPEAEILNTGLILAMEFGENWLKPIQQRLFRRYKFLTKEELDKYNQICRTALNDGVAYVEYTLQSLELNKQTISEKDLKNQLSTYMVKKYSWINNQGITSLLNQSCYYSWKEGLTQRVK